MNSITTVLIKGRQRELTSWKKRQCDYRGTDWSDVATNPGVQAATSGIKRQGKASS